MISSEVKRAPNHNAFEESGYVVMADFLSEFAKRLAGSSEYLVRDQRDGTVCLNRPLDPCARLHGRRTLLDVYYEFITGMETTRLPRGSGGKTMLGSSAAAAASQESDCDQEGDGLSVTHGLI